LLQRISTVLKAVGCPLVLVGKVLYFFQKISVPKVHSNNSSITTAVDHLSDVRCR